MRSLYEQFVNCDYSDDLDYELINEVLLSVDKNYLCSLGVLFSQYRLTSTQSPHTYWATNLETKEVYFSSKAGYLLFANKESKGPFIRISCFNGIDKLNFVSEKLYCNIMSLVKNIHFDFGLNFFNEYESELFKIKSILTEALLNSFVHCDYEIRDEFKIKINKFYDRIEIENTGVSLVDVDKIKQGFSVIRNHALFNFFKTFKQIAGLGCGIQKMIHLSKELNLKEPLFEQMGNIFRCTIYFKKDFDDK